MKNLILIVFILFILKYRIKEISANIDYRCTPGSKVSPPSLLLKNHLFCSYDKELRPVEHKDKIVNVLLQLIPKFMEFGSRSSTFTLHYWLKMKWTDDHMKWIPGEFEDVTTLHIQSSALWTPDIIIVNTGERFELPSTMCIVKNTGNVTCVLSMKSSVSCISDFTHWPYDKQNCKIRSGSGSYYSHEVDFDFIDSGIAMEDYSLNHEWLMTRQQARKIVLSAVMFNYTELKFEFDIERHSRMVHSVYITPAAILMMLTISVLWLDSRSIERITLAGVNFVCHLFCIYDLHWMVPLNGSSIPHILVFYRDSLVLAAFALITTLVFRKLQMTTATAPKWIFSIVSILEDYRLTRFLVTNDQEPKGSCGSESEIEDNVESIQSMALETNQEQMWSRFANFIEWMSIFSISITYLILLATLIPK